MLLLGSARIKWQGSWSRDRAAAGPPRAIGLLTLRALAIKIGNTSLGLRQSFCLACLSFFATILSHTFIWLISVLRQSFHTSLLPLSLSAPGSRSRRQSCCTAVRTFAPAENQLEGLLVAGGELGLMPMAVGQLGASRRVWIERGRGGLADRRGAAPSSDERFIHWSSAFHCCLLQRRYIGRVAGPNKVTRIAFRN